MRGGGTKQPMMHAHSWWQTGVIYQVYPRSFLDSNRDGIGDLPGIISKLDYLRWLGVDAIWLSPIYPSPMADFGYDISNYTNIHPLFGTLQDLDTLLHQAHQRNLKLILDFVPNHTSDEHPWFQQSRSSRTNEKRDWYIWHDPAPNGDPPNNWMSRFGGPAWQFDQPTGQYYLHLFDVKQVQIVLAGGLIELPGRAAKPAHPVVGGIAIGGGVVPDVPVAFLVGPAGTGLLEPGMFIGGMIGYEVEDELEVALVGLME